MLPESTCWTGPSSVTSRAFSGFSGLIVSFEATSVASPRNVPFAETRRPGRIAENETRSSRSPWSTVASDATILMPSAVSVFASGSTVSMTAFRPSSPSAPATISTPSATTVLGLVIVACSLTRTPAWRSRGTASGAGGAAASAPTRAAMHAFAFTLSAG